MKTDNELIAEFMGLMVFKTHEEMAAVPLEQLREWGYEDELDYHSNWLNLMPIVEKIESLGYYTNIFKDEDGQQTAILHPVPSYRRNETSMIIPNDPVKGNRSKINTTYKAVVEFIKWYNKQSKLSDLSKVIKEK